jgi:ATP-dependent protease ClpP protease subunit
VWLYIQVKLLSRHIGKPMDEIARDIRRPKYFSPSEAVDYGIIDKVNISLVKQKKLTVVLRCELYGVFSLFSF